MQLWRRWLGLGFLAVASAHAAVVYKWTDANGVTHYSDQPAPGSEKIVTSAGSTNGIGGATRAPVMGTPAAGLAAARERMIAIESPAAEQVFFGDEIVPVRLHLAPGLDTQPAISWMLNGRELRDQPPDAVAFALQSLARGTYTLSASVTDAASGASMTSSVTFYVRQNSELSPQHKKP